MKKAISLILVLATCLSLCACGGGSGGKISKGQWVEVKKGSNEYRFSISEVEVCDTIAVATENPYFMKPIYLDKGDYMGKYTYSPNKNMGGVVVVTMQFENTGKKDLEFSKSAFKVNYDDGNMYDCDDHGFGYYSSNGEWLKMNGVYGFRLEKVTSGLTEVKVAIFVPEIVATDSKSLAFEFQGYSCKIR